MQTPLTNSWGKVAAGSSRLINAVLPANTVSEVWLSVEVPEGDVESAEPVLDLIP